MNPIISFAYLLVAAMLVIACQSQPKPQATNEQIEINQKPMRHGWTIFTGAKPTKTTLTDSGSQSRGRTLYIKHCQQCHGPKGKGDGPKAQEMGIRPANLASVAKTLPNHYLVIQIDLGRGDMPQWRDLLTNQQVKDLSNYVKSLK